MSKTENTTVIVLDVANNAVPEVTLESIVDKFDIEKSPNTMR